MNTSDRLIEDRYSRNIRYLPGTVGVVVGGIGGTLTAGELTTTDYKAVDEPSALHESASSGQTYVSTSSPLETAAVTTAPVVGAVVLALAFQRAYNMLAS